MNIDTRKRRKTLTILVYRVPLCVTYKYYYYGIYHAAAVVVIYESRAIIQTGRINNAICGLGPDAVGLEIITCTCTFNRRRRVVVSAEISSGRFALVLTRGVFVVHVVSRSS